MSFNIHVDHRERFGREYLDSIESKVIREIKIIQLEVGDFAVYYGDKLILLIERKTWNDFAASIKDGRLEAQIAALQSLADKGARVMILVEGKRLREHEGIPIANLDTKIVHTMVRNPLLTFIYTGSVQETIDWVVQFVERYPLDVVGGVPEVKIEKPKRTLESEALACLVAIPGVTRHSAPVLLSYYTVREIIDGKTEPETVATLPTSTSRPIGRARAGRLLGSIAASRTAILAGIHGVTRETASVILTAPTITADIIQVLSRGEGKKSIGGALARHICDVLDYRKSATSLSALAI